MLRMNKILFPTDFSPSSESAFVHASELAVDFDAELHVLNVMPPQKPDPDDPMQYLGLEMEDPETWSDALHPEVSGNLRMVHARVRVASALEGILHYADHHEIDMIVMATHGRRGLDHFLLGSVAEDVLRNATCPVYIVREGIRVASRDERGGILVPIDFSDESGMSLSVAKDFAARRDANVELLHVVEEAVFPTTYGVDSVAVAVPRILEASRSSMENLLSSTAGPQVPSSVHVLIGHPARSIVDFAHERETELIVIATHGHRGVERLLIGSVTEKVVRTAPCPVLALKSTGRQIVLEEANPLTSEELHNP